MQLVVTTDKKPRKANVLISYLMETSSDVTMFSYDMLEMSHLQKQILYQQSWK